jgi:tripartite-type tricarboxylate transporter receptor subunit TctC
MKPFKQFLATLALVMSVPLAATAQSYPDRNIKMVLPFPAGSATDSTARYVAEELRKSLGQPVIIENQAGADGNIAAQNVKRSPPDGYTLFVSTNSAHGANSTLYTQLPYDPEKDFEPVGGLIRIPLMLVVRKDFPADDVAGFIKVANERATANPLSYGSGNTSNRVAAELLKASAKIEMTHVPYRGTPQALQDLVGGRIDVFFVDPSVVMGFVNDGQIKVLAVADSTRLPLLPNVPTMVEAGYKDVQVVSWAAVFVPATTDATIIKRLNLDINKALARPETVEYIHKMGASPMPMTSDELRRFVSLEIAHWSRLVTIAGIPKK